MREKNRNSWKFEGKWWKLEKYPRKMKIYAKHYQERQKGTHCIALDRNKCLSSLKRTACTLWEYLQRKSLQKTQNRCYQLRHVANLVRRCLVYSVQGLFLYLFIHSIWLGTFESDVHQNGIVRFQLVPQNIIHIWIRG